MERVILQMHQKSASKLAERYFERYWFTSPDFGMHNGRGFGLFLGFFVCHSSVKEVVVVCQLSKEVFGV